MLVDYSVKHKSVFMYDTTDVATHCYVIKIYIMRCYHEFFYFMYLF